jgi:hypothetical protein
VHAYTDPMSVAAGETIRFYVSSDTPYEFQVCRLGPDVDSPAEDDVLAAWQVDAPAVQSIYPGSYLHVAQGLAAADTATMTLECWVRLWNVSDRQGIITQFDSDEENGFGLLVDEDRAVLFCIGHSLFRSGPGVLTGPGEKDDDGFTMPPAQWHHLVATVNGRTVEMFVDGGCIGQWQAPAEIVLGSAPLRLGAFGRGGVADGFLDADISLPAIHGRLLSGTEIVERFAGRALVVPTPDDLLACWPLAEEKGDLVRDCSRHRRDARIINYATWMIGGPSFAADVPRFAAYEPAKDPSRGHGLRLASDDLYDCGWLPTFDYRLPDDAQSGAYAARIRFDVNGEERLCHALFVVRKAAGAAKAPIAFLYSTNTWKAYSGSPFCPSWPGIKASIDNKGYAADPADPKAAYCWYRHHRGGQPTYQMGMRMPWPAAGPYTLDYDLTLDYSHLCRADRFAAVWLEHEGYTADAITDFDLFDDPELLDGYQVLFIVGHNEYWSIEQYERIRRFLQAGGDVICLSGNTNYWRVSFDVDNGVMECRKADGWGAQLRADQRGECWHSHDGKRGGVPRDCGFPLWELLGVEFMSYSGIGAIGIGPFRVSKADHFLFQTPHRVGLENGDHFGFDPDNPQRQVLGHEGDVRVSTLMHVSAPHPEGAPAALTDPPKIEVLAAGVVDWECAGQHSGWFDYYHRYRPAEFCQGRDAACELIYWERPDGGRVFSASSIAAGWPLAVDPRWSDLLKNVLHHFGVLGHETPRAGAAHP